MNKVLYIGWGGIKHLEDYPILERFKKQGSVDYENVLLEVVNTELHSVSKLNCEGFNIILLDWNHPPNDLTEQSIIDFVYKALEMNKTIFILGPGVEVFNHARGLGLEDLVILLDEISVTKKIIKKEEYINQNREFILKKIKNNQPYNSKNELGGKRNGKPKILFITNDTSNYTVPAPYYLTEELKKLTEVKVIYEAGNINQILEKLEFTPDFIFLNDYNQPVSPKIEGLKELNIPFAAGLHDLQYSKQKYLTVDNAKYVFSYYRDKYNQWYGESPQIMKWLPHHANTEVYKDYNMEKDIDLLLMGATLDIYPLRILMKNRLSGRKEFTYHGHPGYRYMPGSKALVGENFAREINRAKIFLTCGCIYNYTLRKYFEVTACNTLLLTTFSQEFMDLGYIPGVHYVTIDESNFEEKAYYYLKHEEERKMIARNGMLLTHSRHSTKQRAYEFLCYVEEILEAEASKTL